MSIHDRENWKLIVWWCNIPDLTRLWCCGNHRLKQTMQIAPDLYGKGVYQPCLSHLQQLTTLDLSDDAYLPNELLAQLPPRLTNLSLDNNVNKLQLELLPATLTILKLKLESTQTVDLTVLPGSLTELSVEGIVRVDMPLTGDNGLREPHFPHLRSLSLRIVNVVDSGSIFMHCPNLTNLTSHVVTEAHHELLHVPQQLEHLSINMTRGNKVLTPLLKDTTAQVSLFMYYPGALFEIFIFPVNLVRLYLTNIADNDMLNSLPVTITDFNVKYVDDQHSILSRFTRMSHLTLDVGMQGMLGMMGIKQLVDLTSLPSTLTQLKVANCSGMVVPRSVTDLDFTGPQGYEGDFGDIPNGTTGPIGPQSNLKDLIPRRDDSRIEHRWKWRSSFDNTMSFTPVTALKLDQDSKLCSVRGVPISILDIYHTNYFSNLTSLTTYYDVNLHTFLAKLPSGQLTELIIRDRHDFQKDSNDISDLLVACCNCYGLRSLEVSILFKSGDGNHRHHITTELPLPGSVTTLVLQMTITLPGLIFPTSLELLTLSGTYCNTTAQLQQLSVTRLREINVVSFKSEENLWMILNVLPQCVSTIRYSGTYFNHNSMTGTDLTAYIQRRKRFLRIIDLS